MNNHDLQQEAEKILNHHVRFLAQFEKIDNDSFEITAFILKSLSNILKPLPKILVTDDLELNKKRLFEAYNLISELKYNLEFLFPNETLFGTPLIEYADCYPMTYAKALKNWWQKTENVVLNEGKQTIEDKNFNF